MVMHIRYQWYCVSCLTFIGCIQNSLRELISVWTICAGYECWHIPMVIAEPRSCDALQAVPLLPIFSEVRNKHLWRHGVVWLRFVTFFRPCGVRWSDWVIDSGQLIPGCDSDIDSINRVMRRIAWLIRYLWEFYNYGYAGPNIQTPIVTVTSIIEAYRVIAIVYLRVPVLAGACIKQL